MTHISRRTFFRQALSFCLAAAFPPFSPSLLPATAVSHPSLEEMIGAMVIGGFRGFKVSKTLPVAGEIRREDLGGVVLYDYDVPTHTPHRNIASPAQVTSLCKGLQSLRPAPLTIAIDEEGGKISRLKQKYGFPPTVSAQALGKRNDPSYTYRRALGIAKTLKSVGITLNFAPVVDLNINPDNPVIGRLQRSFSADPDVVIHQALAFIRAHHDLGIKCTLKHFPGHGSSTTDSHLGFVDITDTWSPIELKPFQAIIQAKKADAVMTAHVFNKRLDTRYPATLSKRIVTGILRDRMGYDGVIISDDMQMGAIRKYYGFEQAITLAIQAGIDILIIANNTIYDPTAIPRALAIIRGLVDRGTISLSRIEASYRRIMKLKAGQVPQKGHVKTS